MSDAPIGIFDSGVGGLTVARAVATLLPRESIIYIGDTAHTPYGDKPIADVRRYALAVLDDLVERGVKMLVIACNTASAAMLRDARERYDIPVVEVIQPAVRTAVSVTRNHRVGVIATHATVTSRAYDDAFAAAPHLALTSAEAPRFVEFVERGETSGPELMAAAEEYLAPLRAAGIDTLVLGCTHYPFLEGAISLLMGPDVTLVSSDTETAKDVYRELVSAGLERRSDAPPVIRYEATGGRASDFEDLARRMLGTGVTHVELVETGAISLPHRLRDGASDASPADGIPSTPDPSRGRT